MNNSVFSTIRISNKYKSIFSTVKRFENDIKKKLADRHNLG
jgi:hypothetical protein